MYIEHEMKALKFTKINVDRIWRRLAKDEVKRPNYD